MQKELSVKLFEEKQVRAEWDEEKEEWYFSIQDVVEVLTDSKDVKQYIKKMLSRDEQLKNNWGTICTPVEMMATDGKKRKIQASNIQGIFRLIQSIPSPKAEPFKLWLAQVAKERLDQLPNWYSICWQNYQQNKFPKLPTPILSTNMLKQQNKAAKSPGMPVRNWNWN